MVKMTSIYYSEAEMDFLRY